MVKNKKGKKKEKSIGLILLAILLICTLCIALLYVEENKEMLKHFRQITRTTEPKKSKLEIIDEESNSRNIAVMINNIKAVWGYQSGIQDAYLVYEIVAEGGITRLMAVFKDQTTERIGSVRSSRIYYLDYALENDAIYVHIGGSKEAKNDIKTLGMVTLQSEVTFRDKSLDLSYEHTAFATMEKINERIEKRGIRNTTEKDTLLEYSIEDVDLSTKEGAILANEVYILFSGAKSTTFKYDEENKVYKRYQNDTEHIDYVTQEQYTVKNIITYQVRNSSYDSYGRQSLDNIGNGTGYYISNGYAVPIKWEKTSRSGQTKYTYLDGEEIVVNDGNTHIEIQPKNKKLEIK